MLGLPSEYFGSYTITSAGLLLQLFAILPPMNRMTSSRNAITHTGSEISVDADLLFRQFNKYIGLFC